MDFAIVRSGADFDIVPIGNDSHPREAHVQAELRRQAREAKVLRKTARRALKRAQKTQPKDKP